MPKRKYEKPLKVELDFSEPLERFARVDPEELNEVATTERIGLVPLVEDDTGHRFLVYATEKGMRVDLRYDGETFWASQAQMAEMFGVQVPAISKHLKNIFEEGELDEASTFSILESVGATGQPYQTKLYNLNAIISVGYRVGSKQGTMFRIWATDKLFQILTTPFAVENQPDGPGTDLRGKLVRRRGCHSPILSGVGLQ